MSFGPNSAVPKRYLSGELPRNFDWRVGFIGTQKHLLTKVSFSSDVGHFILKMLENAKKCIRFKEKIPTEIKYPNFCGGRPPRVDVPAVFKSAGIRAILQKSLVGLKGLTGPLPVLNFTFCWVFGDSVRSEPFYIQIL